MKRFAPLSLLAALSISGAAFGQTGDMKEASGSKAQATARNGVVHKTSAVVKALDQAKGRVTLAHDPVKTLNWPAMTMGFGVKDRSLLDKLAVGTKVEVEFIQQGSNYIITAVK